MNTLTFPPFVYDYQDVNSILDRLSYFTGKLTSDYNYLFDKLYVQEIFGLNTVNYELLDDIYILLDLLVLVQLEVENTETEALLTYQEYMEKYHIDCLYKHLMCKGINVKPLMIAFDAGYSNINTVPDYLGIGIGQYIISEEEENINDLIIQ